ncbi:MAG: hypothetical protein JW850_18940 [Thermoflexales bacterium]|nr:hypothetical protein [Thermoflexales bacterium]
MEQKAGAQISTKTFVQSLLILFAFMIAAGILTRLVPAGQYTRIEQAGRELIDPQSFQAVTRPHYPVWRWFTAPLEVLWGADGVTIIVIIIFLLMVGGSFAVLDKSGILKAAISNPFTIGVAQEIAGLLLVSAAFLARSLAIGLGPF